MRSPTRCSPCQDWDRSRTGEQFARLKEGLVATGNFDSDQRLLQRLIYSDQVAGLSMPVNLIPFRGVVSADSTIEWPPNHGIVMNVAGFEEGFGLVRFNDNRRRPQCSCGGQFRG